MRDHVRLRFGHAPTSLRVSHAVRVGDTLALASILSKVDAHFILRWTSSYKLQDGMGREAKAWELARGKRNWQRRRIWDMHRRQWRKTGVLALPVRHSAYPGPLWLVFSRPGQGRFPWYLLTSEPVESAEDARKSSSPTRAAG